MTSQQHADAALQQWQQLRALPPDLRIEVLMSDFFAPMPATDVEFDAILRDVADQMGMVDA